MKMKSAKDMLGFADEFINGAAKGIGDGHTIKNSINSLKSNMPNNFKQNMPVGQINDEQSILDSVFNFDMAFLKNKKPNKFK